MSGVITRCPRCGMMARLLTRWPDNATICTACVELPDEDFAPRRVSTQSEIAGPELSERETKGGGE